MIPEVESIYGTSETKLKTVSNTVVKRKSSSSPVTNNVQPVTAWQRYQQFIAIMETSGENINRKLMLEAMFRGNDLAYSDH